MRKSIFIIASVLGAFLMGCQKDSVDPLADSELEDLVALSAARFSAEVDATTKMKCRGKLTELATADLPAAVTEYIGTNYTGAEVKFAAKDEAGNVVVGLALADGTHKGLLFDSTGTFRQELKQYGKRAKLTKVEVASLPSTVTGYVAANYAGAEIKRAGTNEAKELFVMLIIDSKPVVLVFNENGTFVKAIDKPMKRGGKKHWPGRKK